jgi:predicted glycogen debranching enzyme
MPYPEMLFVIHSVFLKKSIFMPRGAANVIARYELLASPDAVSLDIRPLFAHRVNNDTISERSGDFVSAADGLSVKVSGRGAESCAYFADTAKSSAWSEKPLWFEKLIYERDASSDKAAIDSLWSPGYCTAKMNKGDVMFVVLSDAPASYTTAEMESLLEDTIIRQNTFFGGVSIDKNNSLARNLAHASCHLVADNGGESSAIFSGFPSVRQRARDTFIALPGVAIATGRLAFARTILENWLRLAGKCGGIMPSQVNPNGEAATGDIDAGLWFLYAAAKFTSREGPDFALAKYSEMASLMGKYMEGLPQLGAVMDADTKLLKYFNLEGTNNWMSGDADGEPLVERRGYLVEINALWHNALRFMESVAELAKDSENAAKYRELANAVYDSYAATFWNEQTRYLYDWVDPSDGTRDDSIRPNAILAISLPYAALPEDLGRAVFGTCWDELYTTYGLRTLDPRHEKFKGRAEGRADQKKKARLRGMAWPWLLAHFISAYMKYNPEDRDMGWRFIRPFTSHLRRGCLGGASEYFDGVMPYKPHGDVLSAISMGELLRVIHEDLM